MKKIFTISTYFFVGLLSCSAGADETLGYNFAVIGLVKNMDGSFQKNPDGSYVTETGALWDTACDEDAPADEVDYFYGKDEDHPAPGDGCAVAAHRPSTTSNHAEHYHIKKQWAGNWSTIAYNGMPQITEEEVQKYWDVRLLHAGDDGTGTVSGGVDDNQDTETGDGQADFRYNCHGYVFYRHGMNDLKLMIGDREHAELFFDEHYDILNPRTEVGKGEGKHRTQGLAMFHQVHSNYIESDHGDTKDYCAHVIKFKWNCSPLYTYTYTTPRPHLDRRFGNSPTGNYYKKK